MKSTMTLRHKLLFTFFFALLINWLIILFSTRINGVSLSDELGLLSLLPLNYIVSLFVLVILTLISVYWRENFLAILFASLFALYFSATPWLIEPLRVPDSLYHFSRVIVVDNSGHIPTTSGSYFDYPGSTFFGSVLLQITGLDNIFFLQIFFPLLSMVVFYLNFSILVFSIFKDLRVVSVGFLVVSLFGYGAAAFSPVGVAQMLFPLMLLFIGRKRYSLCFMILMFSLVISNPTTAVFLIGTLLLYVVISGLMERRTNHIVLYQVFIFAFTFLAWSFFNSYTNVMAQIADFARGLLNFSVGKGTTAGLNPAVFPLVGISFGRRIFVVLSGLIAIVMLSHAGYMFLKRRRVGLRNHHWHSDMVGPSMILVGLSLTLLFYLALPGNPFGTTSISFYCLGVSLSVGFFSLRSRKVLLIAGILLCALIIPSFIFSYPQEQYDLIRSSVMQGLVFAGNQLTSNPGEILCPYGQEFQAFVSYNLWSNIDTLSIPSFGLASYGYSLHAVKYFVYRIDAVYYSLLNTGISAHYLELCSNLTSTGESNGVYFDQVYSSPTFVLMSKVGS